MPRLGQLLGIIRIPFLALTPVCVLLGVASAYWVTKNLAIAYALLALLGAFMAHISVNALNEYIDFQSGLDFHTQRTPFSGGSGVLPAAPTLAPWAWWIGTGALIVTVIIGLGFIYLRGAELLPLGLLGIGVIASYSTWIQRHPFLCLIAPGLGFGPLMVVGTHFVVAGQFNATAISVSLIPFFLASGLLLVNQLPDIEADASVGRRHYPILIGRLASCYLYGALLMGSYLALIVGVLLELMPIASLLGLMTAPIAVAAYLGLRRLANVRHNAELIPAMARNVLVTLVTPLLIAVGFVL